MIQMKTTDVEKHTLRSSAEVKRPHTPREILCDFPHGLERREPNSVRTLYNTFERTLTS